MSVDIRVIIPIVGTIFGILSILWGAWVVLFSLVDPVGPMYVYFAVPFALFSLRGYKGSLMLKVFAGLFALSHCAALWAVYDIEKNVSTVEYPAALNQEAFRLSTQAGTIT